MSGGLVLVCAGGLSRDVLLPAAAAIVCLRVCVCICLGVPHMLTSSSNRGRYWLGHIWTGWV